LSKKLNTILNWLIVYPALGFCAYLWLIHPIFDIAPEYDALESINGSVYKIEKSCSRYKFRESCSFHVIILYSRGTVNLQFSKSKPPLSIGDKVNIKIASKTKLFSKFYEPYEVVRGTHKVVKFDENQRTEVYAGTTLKVLFCVIVFYLIKGVRKFQSTNKELEQKGRDTSI
jgi:hypothetical protein